MVRLIAVYSDVKQVSVGKQLNGVIMERDSMIGNASQGESSMA